MKFREVFVGKPITVDNVTVVCPEGYCIDEERSTKTCIKFKKIKEEKNTKPFRKDKLRKIVGYYMTPSSNIDTFSGLNTLTNHNLFATPKQAKSALAMAQISQIIANDERFGGVVTDKEWYDKYTPKFAINRALNCIDKSTLYKAYCFLAFHTEEQRSLFLEENEDLVKDYLMISDDN